MALLSNSEKAVFSGCFAEHFDLFARNITINKAPKETITYNTSTSFIPGYNVQPQATITYTPVSGIYPAIVKYKGNVAEEFSSEPRLSFTRSDVIVKVKRDARDFIKNDKTENFVVDGNTYNVIEEEWVQNYLGLEYYYFGLRRIT